jgi:tRNA threonylcarbamoyladenosine modification (KEOPS) complex Cgi121 subunit
MEAEYVMRVASSKLSVNQLLDKIPDELCVQLFDEQAIACREHLIFAYINAVKIHERKEQRSKSLAMEMLLCAARTSQISDAIKKAGAKDGKPFIVFADTEESYGRVSGHLIKPVDFKPAAKEVEARLKRIGIKTGKVDDLVQEIALNAMEH